MYQVVAMPVNANMEGPCTIAEAVFITYEIWDEELRTIFASEDLMTVINEFNKINRIEP